MNDELKIGYTAFVAYEQPMKPELGKLLSEKPIWQVQAEEREAKLIATIEALAIQADQLEDKLQYLYDVFSDKMTTKEQIVIKGKLTDYRNFKKEAGK